MTSVRKIVKIDEEKCDGCGLCVPSCAEGAIVMVDGKAKVQNDALCDGIGNCLGECPQGAITIEEREAAEFDPDLVEATTGHRPSVPTSCPGAAAVTPSATSQTELGNWPVQLHLLSTTAPYLRGCNLLLAADCVGFSLPSFQSSLLKDRVLAIACPKLDDGGPYLQKLTEMLKLNDLASITVAIMEVPCCHGLERLVKEAVLAAGTDTPIETVVVGVDGTMSTGSPSPGGRCPSM